MLFALLDYRDYLAQRGRYSPSFVEQKGGRLMIPENFPNPSAYTPGTLLFMHTRTHFLSWLIMYFQSGGKSGHSIWSHTALFSYDGDIIDVTTEGVIEHPFSDLFDGESYVSIVEVPVADENMRHDIVAHGRSQLGARYGWETAMQMGLHTLYGWDGHYHPKFSADLLILLALLSLPGLRWKRWLYLTGAVAAHYLAIVILSRPARERERALMERSIAETHEEIRRLRSRNRSDEDPASQDD